MKWVVLEILALALYLTIVRVLSLYAALCNKQGELCAVHQSGCCPAPRKVGVTQLIAVQGVRRAWEPRRDASGLTHTGTTACKVLAWSCLGSLLFSSLLVTILSPIYRPIHSKYVFVPSGARFIFAVVPGFNPFSHPHFPSIRQFTAPHRSTS